MTERFHYVIYIRTTPEKLFEALTTPEFNRQFWSGFHQESDWSVGGAWSIKGPDGKVWDEGEVLAFDPPKHYAVTWRHADEPMHGEGYSRATFDLEPTGDVVKLSVTHEIDFAGSKLIPAVSHGWPMIMSNLKTLMETGQTLPGSDQPPGEG
jgi:uncharacterized protein YndB with AHSA1/START domain